MLVGGVPAGLTADSHSLLGTCGGGEEENKPLVSGGSAGLSAGVPLPSETDLLSPEHTQNGLATPSIPSAIKPDFLPLKVCVEDPLEFSDLLGIIPDDLHSFNCTAAEDPLRIILNASGEWIHFKDYAATIYSPTSPLSHEELDIEEFWKTAPFDIPDRITPFILSSMLKSNDVEKWAALTRPLETLEEFGSRRDKSDAKTCLDYASHVPNLRSGKQLNHQVVWGQQMTLDD